MPGRRPGPARHFSLEGSPMPRKPRPRKVRIVRYSLDGKPCPKGTPGAVRATELSRTYYATIRRRRVSLKTADFQLAFERLRKLQREAREKELGVWRPEDAHAEKDFSGHLEDWLRTVAD